MSFATKSMSLLGKASRWTTLSASPIASSSRSMLRFESTSSEASSAPTHYRITLRRSGIGMPAKINRSLESLGLKKRLQSVYRPIGPDMAGAILSVKELVHVDNVRRLHETPDDALLSNEEATWINEAGEIVDTGKSSRKAPRGYRVIGSLVDEARDRAIKEQAS